MITLEMKEELLLVMLFFGFFLLFASFVLGGAKSALPSPNAGALDETKGTSLELTFRVAPASLLLSRASVVDDLPSSGCS